MEKNEVHITVRNIKTGEVLMDKTPAAFICVAVDDANAQVCSAISTSNVNVLVNLIHRTLLEVKRICRKFPDLAILMSIISCAEEDDDKEAQA